MENAIILSPDDFKALMDNIESLKVDVKALTKEVRSDHKLYNIIETAHELGISPVTLHRMINNNEIEYKWVRGSKYFTREIIENYLKITNKTIHNYGSIRSTTRSEGVTK